MDISNLKLVNTVDPGRAFDDWECPRARYYREADPEPHTDPREECKTILLTLLPRHEVTEPLIDRFFAQRRYRESEVRMAKVHLELAEGNPEAQQSILDVAFPQRFEQCYRNGYRCEFADRCFSKAQDAQS